MPENAPRRFVLLRHEGHGAAHFDFMIEAGGSLATWQFDASPALLVSGGALACRRLADHRVAYLDYEGPVSSGRGSVARAATGTCTVHSATATDWHFELESPILDGHFQLHHLPGPAWTLTKFVST